MKAVAVAMTTAKTMTEITAETSCMGAPGLGVEMGIVEVS